MNIDEYLDIALARQGLQSDRQLGDALGKSGGTVSQYRTKRIWPDDDTILRIADLAGIAPDRALIDLNTWRAKSPRVRDAYIRLMERAALGSIFIGFGLAALLSAPQGTKAGQTDVSRASVYIMDCFRRRIGRVFRAFETTAARSLMPS